MTRAGIFFILSILVCLRPPWTAAAETDLTCTRFQLSNGIPVYYHQNGSSRITEVHIYSAGGFCMDPADKEGLHFLTARLMVETEDDGSKRTLVESAAAIRFEVFGDFSRVSLHCLSEDLDQTFPVFWKGVEKPLISTLRIDFIKDQMNYFQKKQEDNPYFWNQILHSRHLFSGGGYGGNPLGTEYSLKIIRKKDIESLHRVLFSPGRVFIIVVSDLPETRIRELVEKSSKGFTPAKTESLFSPRPAGLLAEKRTAFEKKEKLQSFVSLAFRLPGFSRENFALAELTEAVLGKGIGSRLWRIREEKRLAYSLDSQVEQMKDAGMMILYIKVSPGREAEAMAALKEQIRLLREEGVEEEEFSSVRRMIRTSFFSQLEDKEKTAALMGYFAGMGEDPAWTFAFPDFLETVSLKSWTQYMRMIFSPESVSEVIIGPPGR